jgi:orotidine-5'-phosphate decarboxylase
MTDPKVILALDTCTEDGVFALVDRLQPGLCRLKVGKELFTATGPGMIEKLQRRGYEIFLDLKYHDIPNTVAQACTVAAALGVWMVNVHALGGRRMLAAAREALNKQSQPPYLIAVTVLTSLDGDDLADLGFDSEPAELGLRLAGLAHEEGLDGVVCSAREARVMKENFGTDFKLVTPGIRTADDAAGDQRRIMTPVDAVQAGADYLVIGRSITAATDPLNKLLAINSDIAQAALN